MSSANTIQTLAASLRTAYDTRTPIAPIREIIGTEDITTAYAIQQFNNDLLIQKGARIVGRKIGLTSHAVQKQLGVDQPDYGTLLNTMEVLNGSTVSMDLLMQPKVEAEIAFVLKSDIVQQQISIAELISSIDYALASIEIVGSRIENWNIKITDTVADNASASHFLTGHQPVRLENIDLVNCKMAMTKNGETVSEGTGAACLGSPLNAALWLAHTMAKLGIPLRAGEVILSGALGPMANVQAGDVFEARFDQLGVVSVAFE